MKLRSWTFLALSVLLAALCLRLGFWQLARLQERRARIAEIRAGLDNPPRSLSSLLSEGSVPPYQRVTVAGEFDPDHEIVLTARSFNGQAGVHLVTPLRLPATGDALLVDRGWIRFSDRELPARRQYARSDAVTMEGITKPSVDSPSLLFGEPPSPSERSPLLEWRTVDIPAIETQTPYPLLDVYVALERPPEPETSPAPIPQPEIDLSEGPHLGYAIQWFSFAAIAVVGGGYWFWSRRTPES